MTMGQTQIMVYEWNTGPNYFCVNPTKNQVIHPCTDANTQGQTILHRNFTMW